MNIMECNTDFSELYECQSGLGKGGNAKVKQCRDRATNEIVAVKKLKGNVSEKKSRFQDEVTIMLDYHSKVEGILPVLNYCFNPHWWYAMPVATPIMEHIEEDTNAKIEDIVKGCIQLCETLEFLHTKEVSHRDIKPDNIYFYNDRYTFGDFGLVDYPDKTTTFTEKSRQIGAKFTRAPEMERQPDTADGKKADVYSLAKTLWMLLTKDKFGFEGRYDFLDEKHNLADFELLRNEYLVEIHELLKDTTQNGSDDRLTITAFKDKLKDWLVSNSSEHRKQTNNWKFLNKLLFPTVTPTTCEWKNVNDISYVLNVVGHIPAYSYLFFSDGGCLEYHKTETAPMECLDIIAMSFRYRIKPKRLIFENFRHSVWNYFLLELEEQKAIVGTEVSDFEERVVEDEPNHYVSAVDACYGVYDYDDGKPLPPNAKIIHRYFKGKFLIVLQFGPYNMITETADGRHGNCSHIEFREHIETLEKVYEMRRSFDDENIDKWIAVRDSVVKECPFKKQYTELVTTDDDKLSKEVDRNFVENNFLSFDFSQKLEKNNNNKPSKAKYRFEFHKSNSFTLASLFDNQKYYLCVNGKIEKTNIHSSNVYIASDKKTAISVFKEIETHLNCLCEKYCHIFEMPYFRVNIEKGGTPSHLFTKCEIEKLMREADDRLGNILVIDDDGFAHIIQNKSLTKFYPVVHETWCPRNVYVGRYSKLYDLDGAYHYCLGKWLRYLKTGVGQIIEDYDDNRMSEEELINEIEKYKQ